MGNNINDLFERHPELRVAKSKSEHFRRLKKQLPPPLSIDNEEIYLLYDDAGQVNEDELYHQAVLIGSKDDDSDSLYRRIYEELNPGLKEIIRNELDDPNKEKTIAE